MWFKMYDYLSLKSPMYLLFEVTYKCNNKCVFCYNELKLYDGNTTNELSIEKFEQLLKKKFFGITFSGGEPLLSENIFEYASLCRKYNIDTGIITNGTYINNSNISKIKELFDTIQVSLQGYDSTSHDKITKNIGSFAQAIKGIQLLVKYAVNFNVNITLTRQNSNNVRKIIQTVKQIGVKNISVTRFCNSTTYDDVLELSKEDFLKSLSLLENECRTEDVNFLGVYSGLPLCIFDKNPNFSVRGCSCGHSWLTITPTGEIKVCPGINETYGSIENIQNSWSSGFMRQWRNLELLNEQCKNCKNLNICRGGCRTAALNKYRKYNNLDPLINSI